MSRYAERTEVSSDKSRAEIEHTLARYGASAFMYGWDDIQKRAVISFKIQGRYYKIVLPLPARDSREFTHTPERGKPRTQTAAAVAYEQAVKQRWRALALWIKAVLEAVECNITTLEEVLQPFTLLPDGQTVGEWLQPQLERAYLEGHMPAFLPMLEHKPQ